MLKSPYQKRAWPIRWLLWLRYRPISMLAALAITLRWSAAGAPMPDLPWPRTRREMLGLIWTTQKSMAHFRMGNCFTLSEVMADIRSRA